MEILLSRVVARVEATDFPYPIRYEEADAKQFGLPSWGANAYRRIIDRNKVNPPTARVIFWSSWGMWQMMGFNLYGDFIDWPNAVIPFAFDTENQLQVFKRFIGSGHFSDQDFNVMDADTVYAFARFYNGPGNPSAYVASLRKAYADIITETNLSEGKGSNATS